MKNNFIISRTPYRVSLGGGGTDLPFYSNVKGGRLITASINQYLTVSVAHRPLDSKVLVQTTDVQFANNAEELKQGLTLSYNRQRQAAITNEILEIVAGAEALKAS